MCFNIEHSCHTITNIKHGWQLSLQLMTNLSLTCNYSNACLQECPSSETMMYLLLMLSQANRGVFR